MKLNLGCGKKYLEGYYNVDIIPKYSPDKIMDLNKFPYDFLDNSFDEVLIENTLEHLDNPINVLKELIRICKNRAKIIIIVPYARNLTAIGNIQHKTLFSIHSFDDYLLKDYDLDELKLINVLVLYNHRLKKLIPFKRFFNVWFNGIYDDFYFELEVNKEKKQNVN